MFMLNVIRVNDRMPVGCSLCLEKVSEQIVWLHFSTVTSQRAPTEPIKNGLRRVAWLVLHDTLNFGPNVHVATLASCPPCRLTHSRYDCSSNGNPFVIRRMDVTGDKKVMQTDGLTGSCYFFQC